MSAIDDVVQDLRELNRLRVIGDREFRAAETYARNNEAWIEEMRLSSKVHEIADLVLSLVGVNART